MAVDEPAGELSAGLLFGPVPSSIIKTIADNVPGTYIGSLRVVPTGTFASPADVPTEITVDYYVGADGHTHVVVGHVTGSTWHMLSDTTIP